MDAEYDASVQDGRTQIELPSQGATLDDIEESLEEYDFVGQLDGDSLTAYHENKPVTIDVYDDTVVATYNTELSEDEQDCAAVALTQIADGDGGFSPAVMLDEADDEAMTPTEDEYASDVKLFTSEHPHTHQYDIRSPTE